jgi:long-chain acyl-CoA synthetase
MFANGGIRPSASLAEEMIAFFKSWIAVYKCPRSVDFESLPPLPNGKMLKRQPA